jgi:MFS family permease
MSTFYCRADLGKRVAVFFSATSLAGAFSGLLAAALLNMEGLGGKRGWQWIFIMSADFVASSRRADTTEKDSSRSCTVPSRSSSFRGMYEQLDTSTLPRRKPSSWHTRLTDK